jgi:hypothetical protein
MSDNPRGVRNNNPGNVEYHPSNDPWEGLDDPPTDGRFCRFKTPQFGLRVICKLLIAYQQNHGCNTIRAMIDRWAPPTENDTEAYISEVAAAAGVGADDPIVASNPTVMRQLIKGIVRQENGLNNGAPWYADGAIDDAMRLAGLTV